MEGIATKENWRFSDGTKAPAYLVTLVIPERWLRLVVDKEGADKVVNAIGREALEHIKRLEPEGIGRI